METKLIQNTVGVLSHHGIKGQKWGDRNGPPYPLKNSQYSKSEREKSLADYTISKGTVFARVHTPDSEVFNKPATYATYTQNDKDRYKYDFMYDLLNNNDIPVTTITEFANNRKLKVAGYATTAKEYLDHYGLLDSKISDLIDAGSYSRQIREFLGNNDKYAKTISAMGKRTKTNTEFFEKMASLGYDAIVDIDDAGVYGYLPVILLNADNDKYRIVSSENFDKEKLDKLWDELENKKLIQNN